MGQIIVPDISDWASIPVAWSQMVPDQHEYALRADLNPFGLHELLAAHITLLCAEGLLDDQDIVVARDDWSSSSLTLSVRGRAAESFSGELRRHSPRNLKRSYLFELQCSSLYLEHHVATI
jgi:hypothetical protein